MTLPASGPFFFCLVVCFVACEIRPVPANEILQFGNDLRQQDDEQRRVVIALDFEATSITEPDARFYVLLRESVASAMNKMLSNSATHSHRFRPDRLDGSGKSEWRYTMEDVAVTGVSSVPSTHANFRITVCVNKKGGHLSSVDDVREAIRKEQKSISHRVGLPLVSVTEGLSSKKGRRVPRADDNSTTESQEKPPNIWDAHRWLFIAILIFIGISIVLTIICCICLRCRRKASARNKTKEEIKEEPNQMVSSSNSPGLMQEQSPLNEPPPIDEENGWIIPLDQMTKEELEQPEVQVSRL